MWHYMGYATPRWDGLNDNERAQEALAVTYFHWGLHGWVPYAAARVEAPSTVLDGRRGGNSSPLSTPARIDAHARRQAVIGSLRSLVSYRRGLPLPLCPCLSPLRGEGIAGRRGT